MARNSTLDIRWTPEHAGVEGNEQADATARAAAEGREGSAESACLREASLSHFTGKPTEARSEATSERILARVGRGRRYRPPKGGKLPKGLARTREELAGRFYQLLSGHAATAEHLLRVGQAPSSRCWWCGSGERQSRYHLFFKCRRWGPEIKWLWQRVERDCGGG